MKIAFDLRWIRSEHIDGTSRYAIDLVSRLIRRNDGNHYLLPGRADLIERFIPGVSESDQAQIVHISERLLSINDFLRTPKSLEALGIDIYHSPSYLGSPFTGEYAKILTVFDLIPFLFPEALSKGRRFWKLFYATRYPARVILRSAQAIVTASAHTKRDLVRLLHLPERAIHVIGIGLDARFDPGISVPDEFFQRHNLPRRFLLYVGRQDPYKGLNYLVDAVARLPQPLRDAYAVVIAGKTDPRYIGDIHRLIEHHGLRQRMRFLDYVPEPELPLLYSAATLLVHPSLYEGFGLPPLEAMACGTPVVYADSSSLTELLADAGYAVQPASADALASGIQVMLTDDALRTRYGRAGAQHVSRYSWETIIQQMLRLYESCTT